MERLVEVHEDLIFFFLDTYLKLLDTVIVYR